MKRDMIILATMYSAVYALVVTFAAGVLALAIGV